MAGDNTNDVFKAQRFAIDALVLVGNSALASAERLAALNLHAVREAAGDFSLAAQSLMKLSSPSDALAWPSEATRPHLEKSVMYSRSLAEISSAAQEDAVRLIEAQYSQFMGSMTELANQIAKMTPADPSVSVAVIRSTMQSANDAFARFNQAVSRLTEVAEESVSTVGNVAVSAATGKALPKKPSHRS